MYNDGGSAAPTLKAWGLTKTFGTGKPQKGNRAVARSLEPDVTTPHRPSGMERKRSAAPGIT